MNKKVAAIVGVLLVGIVGVFGMGMKKDKGEATNGNNKVTVTDSLGEKVELTKNPQKVVVFDYGVADILNNMDVEIVGLPKDGTLPEIISVYNDDKYANLGDLKEPDLEEIEALNPDLIIVSGRQDDFVEDFKEIAHTVNLSVDGQDYMTSFKNSVTALGQVFDKEDIAKKSISDIEGRIEELNKEITSKELNGSTIMANEGDISVFSGESRFGMIYNELGFKNVDNNIEASKHGQQVSFEYFLENKPQYVFVIDRGAVTGSGDSAKSLLNNEIMNNTDAAKNDKIVYLDSAVWYTMTGGIDSTNVMLDEIMQAIK